jgi:predicted DCC family thiol-disulfide oxidoreductase YuxK
MATVIYDADCGICTKAMRVCTRLDWFGLLSWNSFKGTDLPQDRMYFIQGEKRWGGFSAVKRVLLRLPAVYVMFLGSLLISPWLAVIWVFFFSPLFRPAGNRIYSWIARNRSCSI